MPSAAWKQSINQFQQRLSFNVKNMYADIFNAEHYKSTMP